MGVWSVDTSSLYASPQARSHFRRLEKHVVREDDAIRDTIIDAFALDPRLVAFRVQVEVDAGVVMLRGRVRDFQAVRAAGEIAQNTLGTWRVRNLVTAAGSSVLPAGSRR